MPLSPEDVQNKRFTVMRFKWGYDEEEVDNFLDEVEEELRRLINENRTLRQTATLPPGAPSPTAVLPPPAALPPPAPIPAAVPPPPPPPPPLAPPVPIPALVGLSDLHDTDDTALRTLMLAQRTAEDAISKAHADAEEILAGARAKATALEVELRSVHAKRLAALEKERSGLVEEIVALRGFEREFRNRLRSYLQSTIGDLDARPSVEPAAAQQVADAQAAAQTPSVGRHSAPLPRAEGAGPTAPPTDLSAAAAAAAAAMAAGPAPAGQPAQPPPAQPPPAQPPPAQPPPARPPAPPPPASAPPAAPPPAQPPAGVPPVAPPASAPPQPPNPFSAAPPPTGPPAQA